MSPLLTKKDLDLMRTAGSIARECLLEVSKFIRPGISTKDIEEIAHDFIVSKGSKPAFLGYKGYPASICTSRNNVVVHGIPRNDEALEGGDILSVDVGVEYEGLFADAAKTYAVGDISENASSLLSVTEEALKLGIKAAEVGNAVQDISWAIQNFVEFNGYNVVRVFVGHGIGKAIHEEPEIPNFGKPGRGMALRSGMVLAIEPMVNEGSSDVRILEDNWTAVTKDGRLSAHFEHTVIITERQAEIVT